MRIRFNHNSIVGNFHKPDSVDDVDRCKLEKDDTGLFLCTEKERHLLSPADDKGEQLVKEFPESTKDRCPAIYDIHVQGDMVWIDLATFQKTYDLQETNQTAFVFLDRLDEERFISQKGFSGLRADRTDDIPQVLKDEFLINNSIIIEPGQNGIYTIFGRNYRAKLKVVRNGVYSLHSIRKPRNENGVYRLVQLYDCISFGSYNDSTHIQGNGDEPIQEVKTNEIFEAWERFMDFKRECYLADLDKGTYYYSNLSTDGWTIDVTINPPKIPGDAAEKEYEAVSSNALDPNNPLPSDFEKRVEMLRAFKRKSPEASIFLGKPIETTDDGVMRFNFPRKTPPPNMEQFDGLIFVSDLSNRKEIRRRAKIKAEIDSKSSPIANIIMSLSEKDVVNHDEPSRDINPVNRDVLKHMFGRDDVELSQTYEEAMRMALNTPDIALIQGPPGTGKTTLIDGVVSRLLSADPSCRILLSSEQHVALDNMVSKVSTNESLPAIVISKQHESDDDDENEKINKNLTGFQNKCIELCDKFLEKRNSRQIATETSIKILAILDQIESSASPAKVIEENIDDLMSLFTKIDGGGVSDDALNSLRAYGKTKATQQFKDPKQQMICRLAGNALLYKEAYIGDNGQKALGNLNNYLIACGFVDVSMDEDLFNAMMSEDEALITERFPEYLTFIEGIKDRFDPKPGDDLTNASSLKDRLDKLREILKALHSTKQFTPEEIVEQFSFMISDSNNVAESVKTYTSVLGSTCAQADRSTALFGSTGPKFDYVIIDEAARANPLEIMNPILKGTRVLLVGDQAQLPHFIETELKDRFNENASFSEMFDRDLLSKSLFQLLYDNLELAYKERRIKYRRTIRLNEQFRMNPAIGKFISSEFYEDENGSDPIENGEGTSSKVNNFNVYDGKSIVCIDIDHSDKTRFEHDDKPSFHRDVEIDKTIDILRELFTSNPGKDFSVGVISFYKNHSDILDERISKEFPEENRSKIEVGTVDSFQGKEFDIVIVNGVRANIRSKVGFVSTPSRINVALSRAKRLLIMIGDSSTLRSDEHLGRLFDYAKEEGYYEEIRGLGTGEICGTAWVAVLQIQDHTAKRDQQRGL